MFRVQGTRLKRRVDFHFHRSASRVNSSSLAQEVSSAHSKGADMMSLFQPKQKIFQSKWGYHPVDKEDYLLLKRLYKRYWETLYQACAWARWKNKDPHNRRGPEPKIDERFIDTSKRQHFTTTNKDGYMCCKSRRFLPRLTTNKWDRNKVQFNIVEDFRNARCPRLDPQDVQPVDMKKYREFAKEVE